MNYFVTIFVLFLTQSINSDVDCTCSYFNDKNKALGDVVITIVTPNNYPTQCGYCTIETEGEYNKNI